MATLSKPVGYECEFVDQVPEDYFCKQCKHVAREPIVTSCCTEALCKACIDVVIQDKKPCPSCGETGISALGPHKKYQPKILALKVHCTMKDRGCEWTGQLQQLDAHLDITTGDCTYVDIDCPSDCNQKVQKRNVDTHLAKECPNRNSICPHCSFRTTFREVSQHFEVCRYYPLVCPNRCGATFERDDLEDHMKLCGLVKVQCDFSYASCQAEFLRDNQEKHMEQNTQRHLALMMAAATLRITQEQQQTLEQKLQEQKQTFEQKLQEQQQTFEKKLQEQKQTFEQKLQEQQQTFEQKLQEQQEVFEKKLGEQQKEQQKELAVKISEKNEQIKQVQQKLNKKIQEKERQIQTLEKEHRSDINKLRMKVGFPPYDFTLSNYQQNKARDDCIYSQPMYTPRGHKFDLRMLPNGSTLGGRGTHVSVKVISLKGDHDVALKFPVKFTITVQLLNQRRDQDHVTKDIQCEIKHREMWQIGGDYEFIPHADLEWNDAKQTQYLKDDCLRFRITKIVSI